MIADDLTNDGTTTFGAGNPFTFSGPIAAGTFDFQGIAAHEISEVMGRLGLMGATIGSFANSYDLADLFTFTGSGARAKAVACPSNDNWFSIDNGTTLLKRKNDYCANGLDTEDWAPGTNDSFNQFSNSDVVNPVSWWICGKWTCSGTTVWLRRLNRRRSSCLPVGSLPSARRGSGAAGSAAADREASRSFSDST